jgi:hypothetical protein
MKFQTETKYRLKVTLDLNSLYLVSHDPGSISSPTTLESQAQRPSGYLFSPELRQRLHSKKELCDGPVLNVRMSGSQRIRGECLFNKNFSDL